MIDFGAAVSTMLRAEDTLENLYAVHVKSFTMSPVDHDRLIQLAKKDHYVEGDAVHLTICGMPVRFNPKMARGFVAMCDKDGKVLAVTKFPEPLP